MKQIYLIPIIISIIIGIFIFTHNWEKNEYVPKNILSKISEHLFEEPNDLIINTNPSITGLENSFTWNASNNPFGLQNNENEITIETKQKKNAPLTTNQTDHIIVQTIETNRVIITRDMKSGAIIKKTQLIKINHVSLPLAWAEYHESFRKKYHFPFGLWEWLFENEKMDDLIDPTTIPREEWDYFINIAFQKIKSYNKTMTLNKEAIVIDFTEDFVYVLFLLPHIEFPMPGYDFLCRVKINRKTGEVVLILDSV